MAQMKTLTESLVQSNHEMNDKSGEDDVIEINSDRSGDASNFEGYFQDNSAMEVNRGEGHDVENNNAEGEEDADIDKADAFEGNDVEDVNEGDGDMEERA